jgi:heme/copper-type cytochrome/quinol oxidase subunit 2
MKSSEDLIVGESRFLEVDNRLVLPVGIKIQMNITSRDVIHSFALPSLGVKADATAGILNVVGTTINKIGTHYGQCSEICGMNHAYMPIVVEGTMFISFYYWVVSHF